MPSASHNPGFNLGELINRLISQLSVYQTADIRLARQYIKRGLTGLVDHLKALSDYMSQENGPLTPENSDMGARFRIYGQNLRQGLNLILSDADYLVTEQTK